MVNHTMYQIEWRHKDQAWVPYQELFEHRTEAELCCAKYLYMLETRVVAVQANGKGIIG